jgi:hypothetical protein
VTAEGKVFSWWFWPLHEVQGVSDEFVAVAEGFRIRLMGNSLKLSFEASGTCSPNSARTLADTYVAILARHLATHLSLITEQEFAMRTEPPLGHVNSAFSRSFRSRSEGARAVGETRNEMLGSTDRALRECYNYLQDAYGTSLPEVAAYAAYKAIEVLEDRFGSQTRAVDALGKLVKEAKTAANQKRHIPKKGQLQPKTSGEPVELTSQVIQRYERYLLELHGCAQASTQALAGT